MDQLPGRFCPVRAILNVFAVISGLVGVVVDVAIAIAV
jgi:hypothetical protein